LVSSKAIRHITPATVIVVSVLLGLAAVAAAVNDQRLGSDDRHDDGGEMWMWI